MGDKSPVAQLLLRISEDSQFFQPGQSVIGSREGDTELRFDLSSSNDWPADQKLRQFIERRIGSDFQC